MYSFLAKRDEVNSIQKSKIINSVLSVQCVSYHTAMTALRRVGRRRPRQQLSLMFLLVAAHGAWVVAENATAACPMNETETAPGDARLVDGVLWAGSPERPYGPSAYRRHPDGTGFVLCACGEAATKPCLRKCCKPGRAYVEQKNGQMKCSWPDGAIGNFSVPQFVNATGTFGSYEKDRFRLIHGKQPCSNANTKRRLEPSIRDKDEFRVSETGSLSFELGSVVLPPDRFCLEQFSDFDFRILAIVCHSDSSSQNDENGIRSVLYMVGMILSLPFLLITFLVYALIKELQNLHGKSLMCHVATLLLAYTSLVVNTFTTNSVIHNGFCITIAFIMQFFFLASFFWLNIMCFDLWLTFSRFRPPRGSLNEYESKKFFYYSIYSWGCTSLISIFTYCKQTWPNLLSTIVSPELGVERCWFSSKLATMLYFYGPIGILLFSNLLMFMYTAFMIVKHMKDAKVLNRRDSQKNINHEKQRFVLYLKLFIVMGVNWLAEIVSWAIGSEVTPDFVWYVTDIGNALQGVLIFFIFVCKKRVLILLNKKFNLGFRFPNTSNNDSTRTTNSTISKTYSTKTKEVIEINSIKPQCSVNNHIQDVEF